MIMFKRALLTNVRQFSTSRTLLRSYLSADYKSPDIWKQRFRCPYLNASEDVINSINNKIISGSDLTNLELDIFVNIASGSKDNIAQLKETIQLVQKVRASNQSHMILPSTQHALCRLFMSAGHLPSLVKILENRVRFGIFPDFFAMNLLLDESLNSHQLAIASKLASLVMLQEEFGINSITDALSALSVTKYIESKTDFSDWPKQDITDDPMFTVDSVYDPLMDDVVEEAKPGTKKSNDDNEEEEEDVQYIRIPWLRNSYDDNHFDLENPKLICGKTCIALGHSYIKEDEQFGKRLKTIGKALQEGAETMPSDVLDGLSEAAEKKVIESGKFENEDTEDLRKSIDEWSKLREIVQAHQDSKTKKEALIDEIKRKKKELEAREQYLYFYDELKKANLTRVEYE